MIGSIVEGKGEKPDATFTMLDDDFMQLAAGKLNPQSAFMGGKMKIKGNMAKAMKFTPDVLPKDAKL
jgi:putative sterol carrier protein